MRMVIRKVYLRPMRSPSERNTCAPKGRTMKARRESDASAKTLRVASGNGVKKLRPDNRRQRAVEVKVVPFKDRARGRSQNDLLILCGHRSGAVDLRIQVVTAISLSLLVFIRAAAGVPCLSVAAKATLFPRGKPINGPSAPRPQRALSCAKLPVAAHRNGKRCFQAVTPPTMRTSASRISAWCPSRRPVPARPHDHSARSAARLRVIGPKPFATRSRLCRRPASERHAAAQMVANARLGRAFEVVVIPFATVGTGESASDARDHWPRHRPPG